MIGGGRNGRRSKKIETFTKKRVNPSSRPERIDRVDRGEGKKERAPATTLEIKSMGAET